MPREIFSFEEFLKIIWQSDGIEFDDVILKLLESAWMYISMSKT